MGDNLHNTLFPLTALAHISYLFVVVVVVVCFLSTELSSLPRHLLLVF